MVRTLAGCAGSATAFSNISFSKSTKNCKGSYTIYKLLLNASQNQTEPYAGPFANLPFCPSVFLRREMAPSGCRTVILIVSITASHKPNKLF
jgi:hypothetical protein